VGLWI